MTATKTLRTSSKSKYLKWQNAPFILTFVVWCFVLLFASYSDSLSYENLKSLFSQLNAKDSLILLLSPVLCPLLSGLISSNTKACLVFWKIANPLPGSIAFSHLARRDPRINFKMLKQQIGKLPSKPAEQNALWYSIYRKYETHLTVEQAHQSFLLFRDLTAIALLFAIIGGVALALLGCHFTALAIYIGIMLIHYIGLAWVAQNHGNRLVCNVLVEYALETV